MFRAENEIIASSSHKHSCRLAEQNEGKAVAVLKLEAKVSALSTVDSTSFSCATRFAPYLFPAAEEEFVWINAVRDGAADEREPVKDDWWFQRVLEEELLEDIKDDCENQEPSDSSCYNGDA